MQLTRDSTLKWLTWARRFFLPLALGFLLYSAYGAGSRLAPLLTNLSVRHLLMAWVLWSTAQWISPLTTFILARVLGLPLGYRELSLISVLRLPAKYLPGGIWQSVARFTAYTQHEVKKADSLTILIAEHLLALGVSATLGVTLLLHTGGIHPSYPLTTSILYGALTILILTSSGILWIRGGGIKTLGGTCAAMLATALFWTVAAASFCEYWAAAFDLHTAGTLRVASCYLLSWAAGFVTPFAPQGLGVFEWVAGHLLLSDQPLSVTVTVVAGFRFVTIAADFSAWILALVLKLYIPHQANL